MNVESPILSPGVGGSVRGPILVVDDSRAQRHLLAKTLEKWGYETLAVESGEAAIEVCGETEIDFVISDWMMPGMTGVEFCRAFRKLKEDRPGYFILLTAQTERHVLAEGLEGGADDFLSKPFHTVELKARITAGERVLAAQHDLSAKNMLLSDALAQLKELYGAIERDLREAQSFQQALVPDRFHRLGKADVSMLYQPSGHVGGDLVGLFQVTNDRYGVYAVDVAGHGVASALMTARVAGFLNAASPERNLAIQTTETGQFEMRPPGEVCRRLNNILLAEAETDRYLTMVLADVDLSTGKVRLCQAGHPSPLILRADGQMDYVSSYGLPVGLIPDAEYTDFEVDLRLGDRLLLYSDGITECPIDEAGTLLDEGGLEDLLKSLRAKKGMDFIDAVQSSLSKVSGLTEFPDDLSAVLIEF